MIAAIIQARMNAQRLPNKPTVPLAGHTLLGWTILAAKASRLVDRIIVATTVNPDDDQIEEIAHQYGVAVFRGSEEDVLDRYLQCARHFEVDVIVRISGDSPMWCPWLSDFIVAQHLAAGVDYAANCIRDVFPLGVQSEVFTTKALAASVPLADRLSDHEHVTPALRRHYPRFSVLSVLAPAPLYRPQYRICVDDQNDLAVVRELFARLPHPPFMPPDLLDICQELDANAELRERNALTQQKYRTGKDIQQPVPSIVFPLSYRDEFYQQLQAQEA